MSLPAAPLRNPVSLNDREQIQYLLGNPPSWMLRYGISVIGSIVLVMLILSYFIHYPDVVETQVVLTTTHPPIRVVSESGGRVAELMVSDKQLVKKGQVLAVMDNTARWQDIMTLEHWLEMMDKHSDLPAGLQLGELQNACSTFSQRWKERQYFERHNGVAERIAYFQQQIRQLQQVDKNLVRQLATAHEEFELAEKGLSREKHLYDDQVLSDKEFETAEAQFLGKKKQFENAEGAMLQNQIQIHQLESRINDLRLGKFDRADEIERSLSENRQQLRSALSAWKQTYLVTAPIEGQVSFSKVWSAQQNVQAGQEVMAVVPVSNDEMPAGQILGKATITGVDAGKIATGQRILIRLDGYPVQKYGSLESTVAGISLLPQNESNGANYLIDLYLPGVLQTSSGKTIPFRQEMSGHIRIVTEDRRVIARIFGRMRDLIM